MMKIVQLNMSCGVGSTGKICVEISEILNREHIENYILYSSKTNGYANGISCSNDAYIKMQALKSRIFGNYGFNSKRATERMIAELDRIKPDIVHLHNLHGHDCHLGMLLSYLEEKKIKLFWTFHDCWTFTGYCPYFTMAQCDNWQSGCGRCVLRKNFSWFFDKSAKNLARKKEAMSGLDLTIITPSQWLADMVQQSFLREYDVKVIINGINLKVFQPTPSDFRKKYGLDDKKIVLGVSFFWDRRKGTDVFIELAQRLPEDYQIVLVGTNEQVDRLLPKNIISIHRTQNQQELAEIYTAADVFANPTREEVLGLVNLEALACGTPGVTFRSGGSPECYDETCGSVVACDDIDAFEKEIIRICRDKPYSEEACRNRAALFDKDQKFREYFDLYVGE